ncbi:hypothetical protein ABZT02_41020 [Streptomyces sp. NPDC005402]|uniref:hypothetical protein n=1 Tax=Streptomyces sp. NPDC005402 TaxID=3155338 RepID=UPI0033BA422A
MPFSALLDIEATGRRLTLVWAGGEGHELREGGIALREGGIVFPSRRIPHGYRITSEKADLPLISASGGPAKMFRHAGRDLRELRTRGFEIPVQLLAEAAELSGNVVLAPPR